MARNMLPLKRLRNFLQYRKDKRILTQSSLFNSEYYAQQVLKKTGESIKENKAIHHYLEHALTLQLNPSNSFNTQWYLSRYGDIKDKNINPLIHYIGCGENENRLALPPKRSIFNVEEAYNCSNITLYSNRTDGMGERLRSLVNTIVLAKLLNCQFKFTWNLSKYLGDTHSIEDVYSTFSEKFIEKHFAAESPTMLEQLSDINTEIQCSTNETELTLRMDDLNIIKRYPQLKKIINYTMFKDAFSEIDFASSLQHAIELANNVNVKPNTIAIHLRSGDILYGRYRADDRYTNKAISYAFADYILHKLQNDTADVLIFGQTDSVCNYLASKYRVTYSKNIDGVHKLSNIQRAMFDIVLISRCSNIYAGNSGFSALSQLIGNVNLKKFDSLIDQKMQKFVFDLLQSEEVNRYDHHQNAFSYWQFVFYFNKSIPLDRAIAFLKKASEYDSDCLFYKVVLSIFYFKNHQNKLSEKAIANILEYRNKKHTSVRDYSFYKTYVYSDNKSPLYKYRSDLELMRDEGLEGADMMFNDFVTRI